MGYTDELFIPTDVYAGKRFRPSMSLMLAEWYGVKKEIMPVALSVELFHNFTLIHDDIVDEDQFRRGRPTVWKLWGVSHALNDGDAQMLLACEVLGRSPHTSSVSTNLLAFLLKQYRRVCEGQHLDFTLSALPLGDAQVTEARYFEMIGRKTADLIAAATGAVGLLAGVQEKEYEALYALGFNLGVSYQLADDCMSIWADTQLTGKEVYKDIYERKKTLPVLYADRMLSPVDQTTLREYFNTTSVLTHEQVHECIELIDRVNTYEYMCTEIDTYRTKTLDAISILSLEDAHKEILQRCVDVLIPKIKHD